jgi:hypothetical protein
VECLNTGKSIHFLKDKEQDLPVLQFLFITQLKAMVEDKEAMSIFFGFDYANLKRISCI